MFMLSYIDRNVSIAHSYCVFIRQQGQVIIITCMQYHLYGRGHICNSCILILQCSFVLVWGSSLSCPLSTVYQSSVNMFCGCDVGSHSLRNWISLSLLMLLGWSLMWIYSFSFPVKSLSSPHCFILFFNIILF